MDSFQRKKKMFYNILGLSRPKVWKHIQIPHEWHGSKYLSYTLLPLTVHSSRKLESKVEPRLEPKHCNMACRCLREHLNRCTKYSPLNMLLKYFVLFSFCLSNSHQLTSQISTSLAGA